MSCACGPLMIPAAEPERPEPYLRDVITVVAGLGLATLLVSLIQRV